MNVPIFAARLTRLMPRPGFLIQVTKAPFQNTAHRTFVLLDASKFMRSGVEFRLKGEVSLSCRFVGWAGMLARGLSCAIRCESEGYKWARGFALIVSVCSVLSLA